MKRLLMLGCAPLALIAATAASDARVTRIEVTKTEPFAAGQSFGNTGAYQKVIGRFHGELDPKNPLNAVIVDLDKAPRNARGMVEYSADFYVLKPVDVAKGKSHFAGGGDGAGRFKDHFAAEIAGPSDRRSAADGEERLGEIDDMHA